MPRMTSIERNEAMPRAHTVVQGGNDRPLHLGRRGSCGAHRARVGTEMLPLLSTF
jgi:hypothetical protein